jgi:hypothetical protein
MLGRLDQEIAGWHLAAAANKLQLGQTGFDDQLEAARRAYPEIEELKDYWIVRVMQSLIEQPEQIPKLLKEAKQNGVDYLGISTYAYQRLQANDHFAELVEVLELISPAEARDEPALLNQLAYFRSLSAIDLDQALKEINQALEQMPDESAFLDTRAWILFQMGNPTEALKDAHSAVERFAEERQRLEQDPLNNIALLLEAKAARPEKSDGEEPLTEREAGPLLWSEGVMRYHRARILESLGRDEEATADWQWLEDHRLPKDDRLR